MLYQTLPLLDRVWARHYGAPDFEGRQSPISGPAGRSPGMTPTRNRSDTGDLAARIARARADRNDGADIEAGNRNAAAGVGRGFRLASEFVAAILVGALLGIGLDAIFGTSPWIAIVMVLLGFAAGVLNVVRASRDIGNEGSGPEAPPAGERDE